MLVSILRRPPFGDLSCWVKMSAKLLQQKFRWDMPFCLIWSLSFLQAKPNSHVYDHCIMLRYAIFFRTKKSAQSIENLTEKSTEIFVSFPPAETLCLCNSNLQFYFGMYFYLFSCGYFYFPFRGTRRFCSRSIARENFRGERRFIFLLFILLNDKKRPQILNP